MAYTQSDEISLLLVNYETPRAESWFKNNLQKLVSVSANMATLAFNRAYRRLVEEQNRTNSAFPVAVYEAKQDLALFDSRAFVLPQQVVCNYFIDRQQDAFRNSIQGLAQTTFSRKELVGLNQNQLQEKLWQEKGLNWSACPDAQKRGSCILRTFDGEGVRRRWKADLHIPVTGTMSIDLCIQRIMAVKSSLWGLIQNWKMSFRRFIEPDQEISIE